MDEDDARLYHELINKIYVLRVIEDAIAEDPAVSVEGVVAAVRKAIAEIEHKIRDRGLEPFVWS